MEIRLYQSYDSDEILALYTAVGWTNYTQRPQVLAQAYAHSLLTLGAYEDGGLVGILRAVGDGASIVFVQDLLVLPAYQRRGIGTALVNALFARYSDVYQIELLTDNTEKTLAFYQSLGFTAAETIGCRAFIKMK